MSNPWDNTPSIWDGWIDQCFGRNAEAPRRVITRKPDGVPWRLHIGERGLMMSVTVEERIAYPFCAGGYVRHQMAQLYHINRVEVYRRLRAVDNWLLLHLGVTLVQANDHLRWTPDQFRELDRRLEWEYQQAQLAKQIDAIPIPTPEAVKEEPELQEV